MLTVLCNKMVLEVVAGDVSWKGQCNTWIKFDLGWGSRRVPRYITNIYQVHTVHSPTDAHLLELWLKFTLKLDWSYMFRSRPSSGSLQLSLAKVILTLKYSVKLRHFTECFNVNITLARLNWKLPDDGRRPKHVGAI